MAFRASHKIAKSPLKYGAFKTPSARKKNTPILRGFSL